MSFGEAVREMLANIRTELMLILSFAKPPSDVLRGITVRIHQSVIN